MRLFLLLPPSKNWLNKSARKHFNEKLQYPPIREEILNTAKKSNLTLKKLIYVYWGNFWIPVWNDKFRLKQKRKAVHWKQKYSVYYFKVTKVVQAKYYIKVLSSRFLWRNASFKIERLWHTSVYSFVFL